MKHRLLVTVMLAVTLGFAGALVGPISQASGSIGYSTNASNASISSGTNSQSPTLVPGPDKLLSVTSYSGSTTYYPCDWCVEPYVVVGTDGTIHVAWMDGPGGMMYSESRDGGMTFDVPIRVSGVACPDCGSVYPDPSMGISPNGTVFLASSNGLPGNIPRNNHLVLAKKDHFYLSFTNKIVESCNACFDRPWMAISRTGTIFLVWDYVTDPYGTWWAKSTDNAQSFSKPIEINPNGSTMGIAVDDKGNLHVAMLGCPCYQGNPNEIQYSQIDNKTLRLSTTIMAEINEPYRSFDSSANNEFFPGPAIAVDRSDVYVVYSSDLGKSLYLRHSGDTGLNWDAPVLIRGGHGLVEMPWAAAMNGSLLVAWRENGSGHWNTYLTVYANGTFAEPVMVSDSDGFPAGVNNWHGDFLGVAFINSNSAAVTWSDGRNGVSSSFGGGNIYLSIVKLIYAVSSATNTSSGSEATLQTTALQTTIPQTTSNASSTLMMPLQPVSPTGSNVSYQVAAIGAVAVVAVSVIVIIRKRRTANVSP